jgi:hypothetical protein
MSEPAVGKEDEDLLLQALIAAVSVAQQPAGASQLVAAGCVAAVVHTLAVNAPHIGVIIAGGRLLKCFLWLPSGGGRGGSALDGDSALRLVTQREAAVDLVECGGVQVLVALLASSRGQSDDEVALFAVCALVGAMISSGSGASVTKAARDAGASGVCSRLLALHEARRAPLESGSEAAELMRVLHSAKACLRGILPAELSSKCV